MTIHRDAPGASGVDCLLCQDCRRPLTTRGGLILVCQGTDSCLNTTAYHLLLFQESAVPMAATLAMKPSQPIFFAGSLDCTTTAQHRRVMGLLTPVLLSCSRVAWWLQCHRCVQDAQAVGVFLVRCADHHGNALLVVAVIIVMRYSNHLGTREHAEDDTVTGSMLTLLSRAARYNA